MTRSWADNRIHEIGIVAKIHDACPAVRFRTLPFWLRSGMGPDVKHQACFDTVHRTACRGASSGFRLAHTMPLLRKIGTCFSVFIGTPVGVIGRVWERFGTEKRDTSEQKATHGDSDEQVARLF